MSRRLPPVWSFSVKRKILILTPLAVRGEKTRERQGEKRKTEKERGER
jgi:hypothetical protein